MDAIGGKLRWGLVARLIIAFMTGVNEHVVLEERIVGSFAVVVAATPSVITWRRSFTRASRPYATLVIVTGRGSIALVIFSLESWQDLKPNRDLSYDLLFIGVIAEIIVQTTYIPIHSTPIAILSYPRSPPQKENNTTRNRSWQPPLPSPPHPCQRKPFLTWRSC